VQTATARTRDDGRWWRFLAVLLTTGVVLLPLAGILASIFGANPATGALPTPGDLAQQFGRFLHGPALIWF
jgi:hypothetical protein